MPWQKNDWMALMFILFIIFIAVLVAVVSIQVSQSGVPIVINFQHLNPSNTIPKHH
jgi:flagellar biosynthesis protein FlhB